MRRLEQQSVANYSIMAGSEGLPELAFVFGDDPKFLHYRHNPVTHLRGTLIGMGTEFEHRLIAGFLTKQTFHKMAHDLDADSYPVSPRIGTHAPDGLVASLLINNQKWTGVNSEYPRGTVPLVTIGNGSLDQPTVQSTFLDFRHFMRRGIPVPMVLVVSNNNLSINTPALPGETEAELRQHGFPYFRANGQNFLEVVEITKHAKQVALATQGLVVVEVETIRNDGHSAKSSNENVSEAQLADWQSKDALLATVQLAIHHDIYSKPDLLALWTSTEDRVNRQIAKIREWPEFSAEEEVTTSISWTPKKEKQVTLSGVPDRALPLRKMITTCIKQDMEINSHTLAAAQNMPGHYGRFLGIDRTMARRTKDLHINEIFMGALAKRAGTFGVRLYLENSYDDYKGQGIQDQIKEFGLLLQMAPESRQNFKGFIVMQPALPGVKGGPTHTENWFPEIGLPGIYTFCPASSYAAYLVYELGANMAEDGLGVVVNEPTRLYYTEDLFKTGDKKWTFKATKISRF